MRLNYNRESDALYIDLAERPSVESQEICQGIVLDYDAAGALVGIDIEHASAKVDLTRIVLDRMPGKIQTGPA
jgi:uncharacterized protein YuzE